MPLQVTLSGFSQDSDYENYAETIKKLYGDYSGVLNKQTDILCATTVNSQKYKIAGVLKDSKIKVVGKQWMLECFSKQKRVDPRNYEIQTLFYGLKLGLHGFNQEELKKIISKIEKEEGFAKSVKLDEVYQNDYHCIMVSSKCAELPANVNDLRIPIVTMEWYNRCLEKQKFVFPIDYALNYEILNNMLQMPKLSKCAIRAKQILKKQKLDDTRFDFFKGKIFYLHKFDQQSSKQTKLIIATYGGFYLDQLSSMHTHILCSDYNQEEYKMFLKYGNCIKIVKLSWLFDCIITEISLPEDDYILRKYNIKIKEKTTARLATIDPNSYTFSKIPTLLMGEVKQPSLRRGVSISMTTDSLQYQTGLVSIKSQIFKDKKFYFRKQQYKKQHLRQLFKKVNQNSGIIPKELNKDEHFYLVMVDSKQNLHQIKRCQRYVNMQMVSYRWINYCIKHGEFFDPTQKGRFIFRPYTISTPVSFLLPLTFDIIGYDEIRRRRIDQLLQVVGKNALIKRKELVSHVICEPSKFKQEPRYKEYQDLLSTNSSLSIKFIKLNWILESISQSVQQPIEKYILQ